MMLYNDVYNKYNLLLLKKNNDVYLPFITIVRISNNRESPVYTRFRATRRLITGTGSRAID